MPADGDVEEDRETQIDIDRNAQDVVGARRKMGAVGTGERGATPAYLPDMAARLVEGQWVGLHRMVRPRAVQLVRDAYLTYP